MREPRRLTHFEEGFEPLRQGFVLPCIWHPNSCINSSDKSYIQSSEMQILLLFKPDALIPVQKEHFAGTTHKSLHYTANFRLMKLN